MISSRENGVVKLCRRLQSSGRARREEGLFLAEGSRLCREAVSAGLSVSTLLATPEALEKNPWLEEPGRGELLLISQGVAKAISDTQSPQGVFCLCALPQERELSLQEGGRYLLLDRLQDPGNLGTIIRGAEAFGVTALVLGPGCPDCFSPKVLRSTMGSLFRQPVFHTGDLPGSIRRMGEEGFAVYAAMLDPAARTVQQLPRSGGLGVVIGNEGSGVSPEVAAACAGSVYIPMAPAIESLNAAAAASVLMWEMCGRRRRRAAGVTPYTASGLTLVEGESDCLES